MLEKKQTELLNQELDGTNSEKERAAVKKLLARNNEAKQYFDDLRSMKSMFRQVKVVEPPSYLRTKILNALPVRRARRAPVSSLPFLQALTANKRYRYFYAFAGGAVAGVLLFAIFTTGPSSTDEVMGTMAGQPDHTLQASADLQIDLPQVQGTISAKQAGPLVTAELRLQALSPVDISLFFDKSALRFGAFRQETESQSTVSILEGELRIANAANNAYTMTFLNQGDALPLLKIQIRSDGSIVSEQSLTLESK